MRDLECFSSLLDCDFDGLVRFQSMISEIFAKLYRILYVSNKFFCFQTQMVSAGLVVEVISDDPQMHETRRLLRDIHIWSRAERSQNLEPGRRVIFPEVQYDSHAYT